MPRGYPGTLTHGAIAAQNGSCSCKEVCRPAANAVQSEYRRARTEVGRLQPVQLLDGDTLIVTESDMRCLRAFLVDGASNETVGRRAGVTSKVASVHLKRIQDAFGFTSRAELAVALLRDVVRVRTSVPSTTQRRDVA